MHIKALFAYSPAIKIKANLVAVFEVVVQCVGMRVRECVCVYERGDSSALFWSCSAPLTPAPVCPVCSNYCIFLNTLPFFFPLFLCCVKNNLHCFALVFVFLLLSSSAVGGVYLRLLCGQAYF